jgi:hypothetical protein
MKTVILSAALLKTIGLSPRCTIRGDTNISIRHFYDKKIIPFNDFHPD